MWRVELSITSSHFAFIPNLTHAHTQSYLPRTCLSHYKGNKNKCSLVGKNERSGQLMMYSPHKSRHNALPYLVVDKPLLKS